MDDVFSIIANNDSGNPNKGTDFDIYDCHMYYQIIIITVITFVTIHGNMVNKCYHRHYSYPSHHHSHHHH